MTFRRPAWVAGRSSYRRSEPADVRKPRRNGPNLVESIEQHRRRVPLARQESVTQRCWNSRREAQVTRRDRAGFNISGNRQVRRLLDQRLQTIDVVVAFFFKREGHTPRGSPAKIKTKH